MSLAVPPRLPVRAFNSVCEGLWPHRPPFDLEPEALLDQARKATGLDDLGGDEVLEGLEVLCRSIAEDTELTPFGRVILQVQIHNALMTRLQWAEARATRPEVFEAPLPPPLIIVGLPRSGTTFLHRMLSLAPDARALSTWEVRRPMAHRGADLRRSVAGLHVAAFKLAMPGVDAKHRIDLDDPEECMFLLDPSLCSPSFWVFAPVYGYFEWMMRQDMHGPYLLYRQLLQLLGAQDPTMRLVLKAPAHTAYLEELLAAVPEAQVVQTHRHPVRIASSVNSLFESFHGASCRDVEHERMATTNLDWLTEMTRRSMAARERLGPGRVLDVPYDQLVADPVGTVRRIHAHHGLAYDPGYEARLEGYLERRPRRRFGRHEYSAEEFGMTDAGIADAFAPYIERFVEPAA